MLKTVAKKLLPNSVRGKLYRYFAKIYKKNHQEKYLRREKEIPAIELEEKHVINLIAVPNRLELLKVLPKDGVAAEIGVDMGDFSAMILKYNQPIKLHLIDAWNSERYNQNKKKLVEDKFKTEVDSGNVEINFGYSTQLAPQFEDAYFDWIYIDSDHSYGTTRDDLNLYALKLKKGGIIAGHDYEIGHWNGLAKFGVIEAVHEFCVLHNWEFVYLTMENRDHRSFAIRKM